jgi:hypothetical protein
MNDELRRSVSELQFKDLDKPYFIQYIVLDQERYRASATFGALTGSATSRVRYVQAQVRVGNYDFDNSEFVSGPGFQGAPPSALRLRASSTMTTMGFAMHCGWRRTRRTSRQ